MTQRLLVIGLDGGDDRILGELMDAGRLPVLASLRARGAAVTIDTEANVLPECVWPRLLSGGDMGEHEIHHFYGFEPESMGLRFLREAGPEIEPLWLHLPSRGEGALVSETPELHPHPESRADESCCWHAHAAPHGPFFTNRQLGRVLGAGGAPPRLLDPDYGRTPSLGHDRSVSEFLARSAAHRGRALLAAGRDRSFVCAVFHEPHNGVHALGHHYEPGHWYRPFAPAPELLFRVYEAIDAALAPLVAEFGDANVAVVAARGIRPTNTAGDLLEELLARAGLLARAVDGAAAADGGPAPTERLRRLLPEDVRRRVARRLLPEAIQHRLASRAFREGYAWQGTRVFPLPTWTTGLLRVNVAGRESAGIVPPEEVGSVLEQTERLILESVDADTGEPLARVIRLPRTAGVRDPRPDLLVVWSTRRPVLAARHPQLATWRVARSPTHAWSSHRGEGLVLLAGPGVRRAPGPQEQDALGLAATLLALAGVREQSLPAPAWHELLAG